MQGVVRCYRQSRARTHKSTQACKSKAISVSHEEVVLNFERRQVHKLSLSNEYHFPVISIPQKWVPEQDMN